MEFDAQKRLLQADPSLPKTVLATLLGILNQAELASEKAEQASAKAVAAAQALAHSQNQIKDLEFRNEKLTLELLYLRRMRYGAKTESWSSEQRDLFEEAFSADSAAIEAELEKQAAAAALEKAAAPKPPRKHGRQPLPAHLVRVDFEHDIASCECEQCGKTMLKIGEDVTEKLTVVPAVFSVERHHYPKYACRACETVVSEPVAPAIIDGGSVSSQLLAWLTISKFVDHLPLYRIEQMGARHDVPLPRSNTSAWLGQIGVWLEPLALRLAEFLRERACLHADETPVSQLDPKSGKNKRAYLWLYRSNDLEHGPPIVVFDYQANRKGCHARAFLQGWCGHLMVDDYSGYKASFKGEVIELACMAHARRKFFDLHKANESPIAAKALSFIALLYQIEGKGKNMSVTERLALRQKESVPLLEKIKTWMDQTSLSVAPNSALSTALNYCLRRWPAFTRYAQMGHLPIDNNPAENAVRPIAIGRKNWLFYGSERAGHRAANIHSLLATAKLNGIEPYAWLVDVLEKLPTWPNSRLDELLPLRWPSAGDSETN